MIRRPAWQCPSSGSRFLPGLPPAIKKELRTLGGDGAREALAPPSTGGSGPCAGLVKRSSVSRSMYPLSWLKSKGRKAFFSASSNERHVKPLHQKRGFQHHHHPLFQLCCKKTPCHGPRAKFSNWRRALQNAIGGTLRLHSLPKQ